jgi:hypothetical protein
MSYENNLASRVCCGHDRRAANAFSTTSQRTRASTESAICALELSIFDCTVRVDCTDNRAASLLLINYGHLTKPAKRALLHYRINQSVVLQGIVIERDGMKPKIAFDDAKFLYLFEKDLIIELQKLRRDLYFLHSTCLHSFSLGPTIKLLPRCFWLVGHCLSSEKNTAAAPMG